MVGVRHELDPGQNLTSVAQQWSVWLDDPLPRCPGCIRKPSSARSSGHGFELGWIEGPLHDQRRIELSGGCSSLSKI